MACAGGLLILHLKVPPNCYYRLRLNVLCYTLNLLLNGKGINIPILVLTCDEVIRSHPCWNRANAKNLDFLKIFIFQVQFMQIMWNFTEKQINIVNIVLFLPCILHVPGPVCRYLHTEPLAAIKWPQNWYFKKMDAPFVEFHHHPFPFFYLLLLC